MKIDFVSSHGHTVFHQPDRGLTFQLGEGQAIANVCGLPVVNDFRSKDVSLGGQGAPLVPVGDRWLFPEYDFCLNLGGIANISFEKYGKRYAYDITVANMLLNYLATKVGKEYDKDGELARAGSIDHALYAAINSLAYFDQPYPKSLGYEWFLSSVVPIVESYHIPIENKLCTSVGHIAFQIKHQLSPLANNASKILITGGGARNSLLVEAIQEHLEPDIKAIVPDEQLINYKEALIFAFFKCATLPWGSELSCYCYRSFL